MEFNVRRYNREAWDRNVEKGITWTVPVSSEEIAAARRGEWQVLLTNTKPVPPEWFPPMQGLDILCLASGGGQQAPVFAAAGAKVISYDNSPRQLAQDRFVAERDGLALQTIEGDMSDLSVFPDESFDLVFNPVSNVFVPDVRRVWREVFRVLRHGGALLTGFMNPILFIFDFDKLDAGILEVANSLPYSDLHSLPSDRLERYIENGQALEFGHTLEEQIGGILEAGFHLAGFYEDGDPEICLSKYSPIFIAVRAIKH